jgi:hypothetical protein
VSGVREGSTCCEVVVRGYHDLVNGRTVIRKAAKWGGMIAAVLFSMTWMASIWWSVDWRFSMNSTVSLERGALKLCVARQPSGWAQPLPGWSFAGPGCNDPGSSRPMVWLAHRWERAGASGLDVPLLAPVLVAAGVLWITWRLDALARIRAKFSRCTKCSYSLAGLDSASKCPECGHTSA